MTTTTTMRRLAAVLVVAGVFIGCGGGGGGDDDGVASIDGDAAADSDDDGGSGGSGGGPVDESEVQDAFLEYAQCMRDNGIDMPDPKFDGNGGVSMGFDSSSGIDPESEEYKAADEECQAIIEAVRPDRQLSPEERAEMQDKLVELAECMRARGHDMPDPELSDDGGVMIRREARAEGDPSEEEFQQDLEDCHEEAGIEAPGGAGERSTNSNSDDDGGEA